MAFGIHVERARRKRGLIERVRALASPHKYFGFLVAKLTLVSFLMTGLWKAMNALWPAPEPVIGIRLEPFGRDLGYTFGVMLFWFLGVGLTYLAVLDQRLRCRTCLRRLRMPLTKGGWNQALLAPPRTEYICPFGHGTLRVPELQISGPAPADWRPIDDMWKELQELETSHR